MQRYNRDLRLEIKFTQLTHCFCERRNVGVLDYVLKIQTQIQLHNARCRPTLKIKKLWDLPPLLAHCNGLQGALGSFTYVTQHTWQRLYVTSQLHSIASATAGNRTHSLMIRNTRAWEPLGHNTSQNIIAVKLSVLSAVCASTLHCVAFGMDMYRY